MSLQSHIGPAATALREKIARIIRDLAAARDELKAVQLLCTHDWIADGDDSHHRYFVCAVCAKEDVDLTLPPRSHDRPAQA